MQTQINPLITIVFKASKECITIEEGLSKKWKSVPISFDHLKSFQVSQQPHALRARPSALASRLTRIVNGRGDTADRSRRTRALR